MRAKRRLPGPVTALLAIAACLLSGNEPIYGQSSAPGADQLQMLQGLSQEQRDAILNQIGQGGNSGSSSNSNRSDTDRRNGDLNNPQDTREERKRTPSEEDEEREPLLPVFKGEDWVVVEIDYVLPPRPYSPSRRAPYLGQGAAGISALQSQQSAAVAAATAAAAGQQNTTAALNSAGVTLPPGVPGASLPAPGPAGPGSQSGQPNAPGQLSDADKERMDGLITAIRARNPYRLSRDGALTLPGFPPIPLLGLSEDQGTLRLKVEPALKGLDVRLTRLPIKKTGAEGLKPFGYDLFDHSLSTFAPATNVPVPSDYIVGAGDELNVQLYGKENRSLKLTVGRDGRINLPSLGPVTVAGLTFDAMRATIESRVSAQLIGVKASVSMGDTRSIRVFVLGEARRPGTYTISGLGTITSALYAAGGARPTGSLRNIELKRRGTLVRRLDLYDLLIRGDTSDDSKLLPGDVIFIPPVGPTISVDGEVRRPAIYETRSETTVAEVVQLAGGLTPEAETSDVMLTRIEPNQRRVVISVDLNAAQKSLQVRNGDFLRITRLRPTLDSGVIVQGHVFTPGAFAFRPDMHLTDVFHSIDELMPNADEHYVLIRRELPPDRRIAVLSADLAAALRAPGSAADVILQARDRITVFDLSTSRDQIIQPLMDELRLQGTVGAPTEVVHVDGNVKVPGEYPLEQNMTIAD